MLHVLIAILFCVPAVYSFRACFARDGIEVNHVALFSAGFVAYWVLPIAGAVLAKDTLTDYFGSVWTDALTGTDHFEGYLTVLTIAYLAFVFGDKLAALLPPARTAIKLPPIDRTVLRVSLLAGLALAALTVIQARAILLQGSYVTDSASESKRGTVVAACIFLFLIALLHIAQNRPSTTRKLLTDRYLMCWWPVSLIILLSGTRLYFMSFLLMLMVYKTAYECRIKAKTMGAVAICSVLLMGTIGVYRMSNTAGDPIQNVLSEPIFTSLSLLSYLQYEHTPLLAFPKYLTSDLTNLLPSAIIPGKAELIIQIPDVYSPFGALNSYVSFASNFGTSGTALFLFLFGFGMRRLRNRPEPPVKVMYTMISGWAAFAIFRDPFAVSLVKDILEFSLLIPAGIWALSSLLRFVSVRGMCQPLVPAPIQPPLES